MQRNRKSLFAALASLAAAVLSTACASSGSDGDDKDVVINPIGSENEAHLTLQLPNDACLPGASCAKVLAQAPQLFIDGVSVALGANTRLTAGHHNVAVNTLGWQLTTTAKQNLTVTLPVVDAKCTDAGLPDVPHTDFGASINVTNAPCPTTVQGSATGVPATSTAASLSGVFLDNQCQASDSLVGRFAAGTVTGVCTAINTQYSFYQFSYLLPTGTCVATGYGYSACILAEQGAEQWVPGTAALSTAFLAYPPGTLTANVNGAPQTLTVSSGDELDFNLSLPALGTVPATFATNISFLSARTNPDAAAASITSSCATDHAYAVPAGAQTSLALAAFVAPSCTYTLNATGRTVALSQTQANNISLDRVDVNDVAITREDGSTYTVKGTWTLNYGGVQVAGPFTTGTGVDALPGTYEFSLSYTDFDGPQTQTQTLTL